MALPTTNSVVSYTSNGVQTAFATGFRFLDNSHLVVTKTDLSAVVTTLVLGTDYSVSGANAAAGGTVTLVAAIPNNWTLKIKRSTPKTQTGSLRSQGQFDPKALEDMLDRLEMQIQEMNDGTFTQLLATPVTTAQASMAGPSTVPNSANTNVAGSSASFSAADHVHALAVGPMLAASSAAGQSIPNAAVTVLVFGTVEVDTDSAYVAGTGVFTVPAGKGGHYYVSCGIAYNLALTAADVDVQLFVNGVQKRIGFRVNPGALETISVNAMVSVAAGQTIDCRAFQNSGASKSIDATASRNWLTIKRIQ